MSARIPALNPLPAVSPVLNRNSLELADLERLALPELLHLYRSADAPVPGVLNGRVRGKVLAGPGMFCLRPARALLNSPLWPWRGKRFDACAGRGTNEFGIGRLLTAAALPFEMNPGRCFDGSGPCMVVSYDLPENPRAQRSKRYEIRQVADRLFLSRALKLTDAGYELICFYGLEKTEEG